MFRLLYLAPTHFDENYVEFVKWIQSNAAKLFENKNDPALFNKFKSLVFSKTNFVAVEKITASVIKVLQSRGIKVIALTASNTGKFGVIESMQQWRLKNLKECGVDFSQSFEEEEIIFKDFNAQYNFYPMFYKGMLLSAGNPKGKVLAAFLDSVKWKPKKIIFFDDLKQNCQSVAEEMKNLGIPGGCFWYRAAFKEKIKLNKQIIEYQYNHLLEHENFLTEKEVTEKMSQVYINNNTTDHLTI
jgi:predicted Fe-Mo cluster-binding NifX family protein